MHLDYSVPQQIPELQDNPRLTRGMATEAVTALNLLPSVCFRQSRGVSQLFMQGMIKAALNTVWAPVTGQVMVMI